MTNDRLNGSTVKLITACFMCGIFWDKSWVAKSDTE